MLAVAGTTRSVPSSDPPGSSGEPYGRATTRSTRTGGIPRPVRGQAPEKYAAKHRS